MSSVISLQRSGNMLKVKLTVQPSREKPLLGIFRVANVDYLKAASYITAFSAPIILYNTTQTSLPPVTMYFAYRYDLLYFYLPDSSLSVIFRSDAYEAYLPLFFPTTATTTCNLNFGAINQATCRYLDLHSARELDYNANIKDFLCVFNINY